MESSAAAVAGPPSPGCPGSIAVARDSRDRPRTAAGEVLPVAAIDRRDRLLAHRQSGGRERRRTPAERGGPQRRGPL